MQEKEQKLAAAQKAEAEVLVMKRKLDDISKGAVSVDYKMMFPKK